MICWICESEASSYEHRLKKSDARMVFGAISEGNPIFSRNEYGKPITLNSDKAPRLLFQSPICKRCNTTLTQPNDTAWEKLSRFVFERFNSERSMQFLHLDEALEPHWRKKICNVQLYFAKLLGCRIQESGAPVDIAAIANSILHQRINQNLYLGFFQTSDYDRPYCNLSEVIVNSSADDHLIEAKIIYSVDRFHVQVVYTTEQIIDKSMFWLPSSVQRRVRLREM